MKINYKLVISYDGTRYSGWASQKNTDTTIQGKLEEVLSRMCGQAVTVIGAGRTDAGVHAKAMTANVHLDQNAEMVENVIEGLKDKPDLMPKGKNITAKNVQDYMNRYLPEDISVLEVREASERFHSRYNAVGKTYCYTCYIGNSKPVFDRKYVYSLDKIPDMSAMGKAAELLTGTHDYASFCGNPNMKKSTVRTVDSIKIVCKGNYIRFYFHGDGFLQNMVRIMTGTLLEVGFGERSAEGMTALLEAKDRSKAGFMAHAKGLCLESVDYQ
ncbi:MAG: tRNA pseudouridine(38-40) synthase TruA [Lachnospiraceae bacterium]